MDLHVVLLRQLLQLEPTHLANRHRLHTYTTLHTAAAAAAAAAAATTYLANRHRLHVADECDDERRLKHSLDVSTAETVVQVCVKGQGLVKECMVYG